MQIEDNVKHDDLTLVELAKGVLAEYLATEVPQYVAMQVDALRETEAFRKAREGILKILQDFEAENIVMSDENKVTSEGLDDSEDEPWLANVREVATESLDKAIEYATGTILTRNQAELIADGPTYFTTLEKCIETAKQCIYINISSLAPDSTGWRIVEKFLGTLQARPEVNAQANVDKFACILIDSEKNLLKAEILIPIFIKILAKYPHIKISRLLHLIENHESIYEASSEEKDFLLKKLGEFLTKDFLLKINPALAALELAGVLNLVCRMVDQLDHSKFARADKIAFIGGCNIGTPYSGGYDKARGRWGRKKHWQDYMVKLQGPAVNILTKKFFPNAKENAETPEKVPETEGSLLRILSNESSPIDAMDEKHPDFAKTKQITYAMDYLIDNAKEEIYIQHAYILDQKIIDKLLKAAERKVKIRIVLGKPESRAFARANNKYISQLKKNPKLRPYIQIETLDEIQHSKALIVDRNYALLGSANLSRASRYEHREIAFMVSGKENLLLKQIMTQVYRPEKIKTAA